MSIISNLDPGIKTTIKWIAVALASLAVAFSVWRFGSFISDYIKTEKELTQSQTNEKIAIANRDGLAAEIAKIELQLEEIQKKNNELESEVEASKVKIKSIARQRDHALSELEKESVPDECPGQLEWLLNKALENRDGSNKDSGESK